MQISASHFARYWTKGAGRGVGGRLRNYNGSDGGVAHCTWTREFDGETFLKQLVEAKRIAYGIGQIERCPTTGRLHFQFYIQAHRTQALSWVRKYIADRAHWEQARGNVQQCIDYCSKDDTRVAGPWTAGMPKRQGQTAGLEAATELVCSGVALAEVAKRMPLVWVRHGKELVHLRQTLCLDADRREFGPDGPELWVLWGPSGSGKSRYAKEHWPGAFWKTPYTQWWDGYGTHDTVILDDFRGDCMRLTDLQRLLDWYPLWVEIKGGSLPMLATRYVIVQSASCRLVHQRRPPWDDPQARQGLRRGPWEAPGVPLGAGAHDREPSSLRWMAPID